MFLVVAEELEQKWQPRKSKSGSKAAALQKEFYITSVIPGVWYAVKEKFSEMKPVPFHFPRRSGARA
jgi:hypothetical protein